MTISVADQGAGLTAQEKAQMWDRFFRGGRHVATTNGSGPWSVDRRRRSLPRTAALSPPTARAREKAPPFKSNCRSHLRP